MHKKHEDGIAQSVRPLTTGTGNIFRVRPDRHRGSNSLLYNWCPVLSWWVKRTGRGADHQTPYSALVTRMVPAIPSPPFCSYIALLATSEDKRYRVILSVLDPRKCQYLKDYSLDFEDAYMTTYLAS